MSKTISNRDDSIDSRDVIERIEELEDEIARLKEGYETELEEWNEMELEDRTDDNKPEPDADAITEAEEELGILQNLADQCDGCGDWAYGEQLIRDSYFEDYAQEFASDIGAIKNDMQWPCNCIDWEQACRELQMDYTSVDFDGVEYWIRS